jgi:hypothetical protein
MNRRTFLAAASALSAVSLTPGSLLAQSATPEAGSFPTLEIIVKDDGYTLPATIPAGRTLVTVSNQGTTGSHTSLGVLPVGVTREALEADIAKMTGPSANADYTPDWFWTTTWVGMPDWPVPGSSVTGIVDLHPGLALILNPIGAQMPAVAEITGEFATGSEPAADATVQLVEMTIKLPEGGFKSGKQRVKIENKGAVEHEFAVLAFPAGVTKEQFMALADLPEDVTPPAELQPIMEYRPIAACSILSEGGVSWIDIDLPVGHYAGLCMLPDQTMGMPHAFMGMIEMFDIK